jgi:hypothetical protein
MNSEVPGARHAIIALNPYAGGADRESDVFFEYSKGTWERQRALVAS